MSKATLNLLSILALVGCFVSKSVAQTHKGISFQGVIKLPTGDYPTRSGMTINARILSPNGCILREEEFSGVNISNGYINLAIGTGVVVGDDPSLTLASVMDNSSVKSPVVCLKSDGTVNGALTSFNPATTNGARKFRVSLTIDSYPIVADFNMRAVSYAINSETLNGKSDADFVAVNNAKNLNQANMESIFQRFTKLDALLNNSDGTGTNLGINITGSANNVTGVVAVANGGTGASDAATARTNLGLGPLAILNPSGTADNTTYLRGDGTWATVSSVGSETDPTVQPFAKNAPSTGLSVTSNQLTVSYGTTAGTAAQGNDSRITGAFQSSTTLSGDLSGTLPSPVVEKIKGQSISAAGTSTGQVLRYAGANTWTPGFVSMSDLRSSVTGSAALSGTGCAAGETLSWSSVSDSLACISISITKSQISDFPTLAASATTDTTDATNITAGTLSVARLPTSVTDGLWTASSPDIYRTSGKVGIGTSTPQKTLHVVGTFRQEIDDTGAGNSIYAYSNTYYRGPMISQYRSHGTLAAPTAVLINDYLGGFSGVGYDGTAYGGTGVMAVAQSAENWTTSAHGANLSIYTIPTGSTSNGLSMIIKGGANPLVGIGTASPASALHVGTAPTASANAPLLALGSAPFNGSSGGYFVGNTNGTVIGVNTASGYTGDFLNFEVWGTSKFKIDSSGTITSSGNIVSSGNTTSTGNYSTTGNISTTGTGSITSAGALISNSTTASTSPSTGALIVSGGAGIGGALNVGGSAYLGNSSANYVTINGAASGSSPTITAAGSDANINLTLIPKGSGNTIFSSGYVGIGTTTPASPLDVNGTITLRNAGTANMSMTPSNGTYYGSALANYVTGNNSWVSVGSGGTSITRNVADANPALQVQQVNASSTGDIFQVKNSTSTVFTIRNAGNVGIGTLTPAYPLHVVGGARTQNTAGSSVYQDIITSDANNSYLRFSTSNVSRYVVGVDAADSAKFKIGTSNDFTTTRMTIDGSGNVGIGTTAPLSPLHVSVTSPIPAGRLSQINGTSAADLLTLELNSNGGLDRGVGITFNTPTAAQSSATGGRLYVAGELAGANTYMAMSTATGHVLSEKMRITSVGNVGIGTTSPSTKLSITNTNNIGSSYGPGVSGQDGVTVGYGDPTFSVNISGGNHGGASNLGWASNIIGVNAYYNNAADTIKRYSTSGGFINSMAISMNSDSIQTGGNRMSFWTGAAGDPSERMSITSLGNVGIGTTAPNAPLDVSVSLSAPQLGLRASRSGVSSQYIQLDHYDGSAGRLYSVGAGKALRITNLSSSAGVGTSQDGIIFSVPASSANTVIDALTIQSVTGNLGIGTLNPGYKLDVNGDTNIASGSSLRFGGTQVCTSAGCTSSSDERLKENIQPLENSLENILKLQGVEYDYKDKAKFGDKHQIGVIAQDVEKVYPEVVITDDKTRLKSVAYDHLIAPLIEAVKTLYNRVVGLEAQQATVDAKVQQLEQENAQLKAKDVEKTKQLDAMKAYLCGKDPAAAICK